MINPFDYLFYKLYKVELCTGGTNLGYSMGWMLVLLFLNFLTIYWWLTGSMEPTDTISSVGFASIFILITLFYWILKRDKKVIAKFKNESTKSREIGNLVVICYVILTIVSFILVIK
jgi:hypothetical protein